MSILQFQHTQAATLEAQFQRIFAANDKPVRTVTRIYADGARITNAARPNELPIRIKSEVKK